MALATCMKAMQYVTADAWRPELVSFSDAEPANAKAYRKVFGTKVLFSQEWTGLMFPASDLDRPIANRDDDLEALLLAKVREIERLRSTDHSFVHNVKLLIRQSLNSGHCSQDKIARLLGIHPRQFQRELQRQEVTFRELRAEVRLDLAEQLLGHSSMPLGTIALVFGFSEQSTLSRAFKTKHGISPLEWRSLQQQF
jgi:AraC-like DNA-binding protein